MTGVRLASAIVLLVIGFQAAVAQSPARGRNLVPVRGQRVEIYFYPGAGAGAHRRVLFAPGDGGWRGFAIDIAQNLAAAGYDVYGLDTRQYLQSFTGDTVLQVPEIAADFRRIAQWVRQGSGDRVLLAGWSEGAGLGLVAAANQDNRDTFFGLVTVGVAEYNILAWRWKDLAAEITKTLPKEPVFKSADYVNKVSPLPLCIIASSNDEYATPELTRALFAAAREPKRLTVISAKDHKFSGNSGEFFRALREGLAWIQQPSQ